MRKIFMSRKRKCLLLFACVLFVVCQCIYAQQTKALDLIGEVCNSSTSLSHKLMCVDGVIQDCRRPQGRVAYIACRSKEFALQQKLLNNNANELMAKYASRKETASLASSFLVSQAAWKKFVNLNCKHLEAIAEDGGNASSAISIDCLVQNYKERINVVKKEMQDISEK
jgi:uncharacterized protein YecT (DUF1311 family)